jgi:hypothetical protein
LRLPERSAGAGSSGDHQERRLNVCRDDFASHRDPERSAAFSSTRHFAALSPCTRSGGGDPSRPARSAARSEATSATEVSGLEVSILLLLTETTEVVGSSNPRVGGSHPPRRVESCPVAGGTARSDSCRC